MHIEGTFEPELIFEMARRNDVTLPYGSVEELRRAYDFQDLQSFLNVYYAGMNVLRTERDFAQLADAYFEKAARQNVKHTEIFFDPQAHISRGLSFATVIDGLWQAVTAAKNRHGLSARLIMCFLRDMSAQSAMETLDMALPFKDRIVAVGLDSAERNNPPSKFKEVFDRAREEGFLTVAHAGEEGPAQYVWEAIELLKVSRIDHGIHSMDDPALVEYLVEKQLPLTVCPLSNVKLKVFKNLAEHNLKKMLEAGIRATVNSDDPAYFGGYVGKNFEAAAEALNLSKEDLIDLARNSFLSSFLPAQEIEAHVAQIDRLQESLTTETGKGTAHARN